MADHNAYLELTLFLQRFNVINKIITTINSITRIIVTVVIITVDPLTVSSVTPRVSDKWMEKTSEL